MLDAISKMRGIPSNRSGEPHCNFMVGVWLGFGWTALAEANLSEVQAMFRKALYSRGQTAAEAMEGVAGSAEMAASEGDTAVAVELLSLVADHRFTAHSVRHKARQALADLKSEVSATQYTRWAEKGERRDLDATLAELVGAEDC